MKTYLLCLEIKVPQETEDKFGRVNCPSEWEHMSSGKGTAWQDWGTIERLAAWCKENIPEVSVRAVKGQLVEDTKDGT